MLPSGFMLFILQSGYVPKLRRRKSSISCKEGDINMVAFCWETRKRERDETEYAFSFSLFLIYIYFFSFADLYLILSLMSGQKILQSFRTSKKKGNSDILFYENYSFDLTSLHLFELSLRLTAMHCCKHVINTDHVIGYVDTDDNSNETSFGSHWLEVITCSGRKINRWHTLWC